MDGRLTARWRPWSGDGIEHLVLDRVADGWTADGAVVGATDDGRPFAVRYRILCDAGWRVRSLRVGTVGGPALALTAALSADGEGRWSDGGGNPVPALAGAVDVDLSASPFTNTLPIRRLGLAAGESATVAVAYVDVPDLALSLARQRYTRLDGGSRYRFESLDSGFAADIEVDGEGLVVTYPGLFRRML
ncbi:putative glycolipid-binding domain-containing protein [Azospirillum sp. A39]|uniref:putative glycolipid-binding domain-containing protein n=1 Tax=Azospirillum sp. A39 TaxID=3462279 RepID=UPI00404587BE